MKCFGNGPVRFKGKPMAYIDPGDGSGNNYKGMMENEQVCVLEMTLKAGESDIMHSHPSETVYFETGGKVKVHMPDGGSAELKPPDGFVMWHEEWTHRVENIGSTDIRAKIFEPK